VCSFMYPGVSWCEVELVEKVEPVAFGWRRSLPCKLTTIESSAS
jgi:hypothetical protein